MAEDRAKAFAFWADGYATLHRLSEQVERSGLEASLVELVRMRASQINGCAYCLDRHSKDARAAGEDEQRLHTLSAWRDAPFFSDRERAALALTEAITRVADGHPPPHLIDDASLHFTPSELTCVLYAVIEINAWNRLAITVGKPEPGSYRSPAADG